MAMLEFRIEGVSGLQDAFLEWQDRLGAAAGQFVIDAAEIVNKRAKDYFIGGGESAAVDTWRSDAWPIPTRRSGFLMNSIRSDPPKYLGNGSWMVQTGPRTVYGRRIELGYTGTGKWPYFTTRAFPYMRPGLEDSEGDI